jgi:hypothetical protein
MSGVGVAVGAGLGPEGEGPQETSKMVKKLDIKLTFFMLSPQQVDSVSEQFKY